MDRIKELELEIIKHKNLYYQGKAQISDEHYDKLEEELKILDPANEVLSIVGATVFSSDKIEHDKKMLSLNKTYNEEELLKWAGQEKVISTFKIDGSSCSLIYTKGRFELAKTRGDGKFGENITNKILCMEHIPKILKGCNATVEIRGEVYCQEAEFFKLSNEMEKMGLERPNSQRNIVAGILGRKENIELSRFLNFQAFDILTNEIPFQTEEEKLLKLKELGFETPEFYLNNTKEDYQARLQESKEFMSGGDYLIDGLVFTYNNLKLHDELGETAHHPRYKMAFKFQGDTKKSVIKEIIWQVSRNGILTPVANIESVELSGANVSRVTLHNYGMVKQFKLKAGDEIEIVRSGEVIPKFLGVTKESNSQFLVPKLCPSCQQAVEEQDIRLVCHNEKCPDKNKDDILNFIQKIGIEDLSGKRLEELMKSNLVTDITSLYTLNREQLMSMDKVKDKLAEKILSSIAKSREVELAIFLSALGISGGAYNKCEKIVSHGHDTIEKILNLELHELMRIESFAEKSAMEFLKSLNTKKPLIKNLIDLGFRFKKSQVKQNSNISGLKFCITGALSMKRSDLEKIIKNQGGIAVSSVSKETNFLITNESESSSSKYKKAQELKIPIITENQFMEMINHGES
jgi:DNA ligase (NAD+)